MGLARKGSRRIHVAGVDYRWVVSPDSGFLVLVVERDHPPGQRLEATLRYGDEPGGEQRNRITPAVVRRAVELAIDDGWAPGEKGLPPFRLENADERVWA